MLSCQVEKFRDVYEEMKPLFFAHYDDISLHKAKGFPLDPQYGVYLQRENEGALICVTLRLDGKIIGYHFGFVYPALHYQTCLTHTPDIFFIHPKYRGGSAALRLFRTYEAELRRRGVKYWMDGSKNHRDTGKLFQALGFEQVDQIWGKWL